ncbi:MAG: CPBP family intramembrane metalloprotease [Actinobacteria bacterium]|nr:CPBP family intramembrane metalloprotease [Actinomycetota bacterium]
MLLISYPAQVEGLPLWPVIVVIVALIAFNVVTNRLAPEGHHLLWALGGSFGLLALGILDGNSWTDMGLGWTYLISGVLWGVGCVVLVTAGYLIAASFRRGRDAMQDERVAELSGPRLMFKALVQVPFAIVLFEEIAFRAVLFSMLARRFGVVWAVVISAVLFGLWHILPSIGSHEHSAALGSVVGEGRRGNVLAVVLSVLATTIAGVIFAGLRIVSGSVIAPMGSHWATNGMGYFFSWTIIRWRRRGRA